MYQSSNNFLKQRGTRLINYVENKLIMKKIKLSQTFGNIPSFFRRLMTATESMYTQSRLIYAILTVL